MTYINSKIKTVFFGVDLLSREDANCLLRTGIKELKNTNRVPKARLQECLWFIRIFESNGYHWQARILRSWIHRAIEKGWLVLQPPKEADSSDPRESEEASKC